MPKPNTTPAPVPQVVRYRMISGCRHALFTIRGRKYLHLVWIEDTGVSVRKVRPREEQYMTSLPEVSPTGAATSMLDAGTRLGITEEAARELRTVLDVAIHETRRS